MRKREPFVMVESRILQSEELSVYEKMVYCVLCSFADNETGMCYPSYETIAARAGCSRRKATACIETLAEKGLHRKEERATRNGGNRTNIYYLHKGVDEDLDRIFDESNALVLPDNGAPDTPDDASGAPGSQADASGTPELDSQNYTFPYIPSIYLRLTRGYTLFQPEFGYFLCYLSLTYLRVRQARVTRHSRKRNAFSRICPLSSEGILWIWDG